MRHRPGNRPFESMLKVWMPTIESARVVCANGGNTVLSLELFNPNYYKQDALEVAKAGLAKMKEAVSKALNAG